MRRSLTIICSLALLAGCAPSNSTGSSTAQTETTERSTTESRTGGGPTEAFVDEGPDHHLEYVPDSVDWQPGPGSFEEGAEFSLLEGDPSQREVFTMRIRMPDGFRINPHWHPNVERVTVLSGTLRLGHGEQFDAEAATPLPAGSYVSMPPEMRHYAMAEGETIIQLTSVGPWMINYIDPADDPRSRED